jgi:hypothetical protein
MRAYNSRGRETSVGDDTASLWLYDANHFPDALLLNIDPADQNTRISASDGAAAEGVALRDAAAVAGGEIWAVAVMA